MCCTSGWVNVAFSVKALWVVMQALCKYSPFNIYWPKTQTKLELPPAAEGLCNCSNLSLNRVIKSTPCNNVVAVQIKTKGWKRLKWKHTQKCYELAKKLFHISILLTKSHCMSITDKLLCTTTRRGVKRKRDKSGNSEACRLNLKDGRDESAHRKPEESTQLHWNWGFNNIYTSYTLSQLIKCTCKAQVISVWAASAAVKEPHCSTNNCGWEKFALRIKKI